MDGATMATLDSKLDWALYWARQGWPVFPTFGTDEDGRCDCGKADCISLGKHPLVKDFENTATLDENQIRTWWTEWPNANIASPPNRSGRGVIDLDVGNGKNGPAEFKRLHKEHGGQPLNTLTFATPSGGFHLIVRGSLPSKANHIGRGIDTRGVGGYIVMPGSTIGGKRYRILSDKPIAECPEWFAKLAGELRNRERDDNADVPVVPLDLLENLAKGEEFLRTRAPAIEGNGGDQHTYDTAAFLRDFGISEAKTLEMLFTSGWNDKCEPPWDWDELSDVVSHVYRYGQNRPGVKADMIGMYDRLNRNADDGVDVSPDTSTPDEGVHVSGDTSTPDDTDSPPQPSHAVTAYRRHLAALMGRTSPEPRDMSGIVLDFSDNGVFVIPRWLPAQGVTFLNAHQFTGKSTLATDLACRMACDMPWHDNIEIEPGRTVVILGGEDKTGYDLRIAAWQKNETIIEKGRLIHFDGVLDLTDSESVESYVDRIAALGAENLCLILDSWQRATATMRYLDGSEGQQAMNRAEAMAHALGCPMLVLCHPPKSDKDSSTISGPGAFQNSAEAIWVMEDEPAKGRKRLAVRKVRNAVAGSELCFKRELKPVVIEDAHGNTATAGLPIFIGERAAREHFHRCRTAWAWAVRGVVEDNTGRDPGNRIRLNREQVAKEIAKLVKRDDFPAVYTERLTDLGITGFSESHVRKALATYFENYNRAVNFDDAVDRDGNTLRMWLSGKRGDKSRVFKTKLVKPEEREEP